MPFTAHKSPRWMQRRKAATILSFPYSKWFVTCECRTGQAQQELSEGNKPWVPRNTVLLHSVLYLCKQPSWSRVDFFYHNKGKRGKTHLLKNKQESHANALAWAAASVSLVKVSCLVFLRHVVPGSQDLSGVEDFGGSQGLGRPAKSWQLLAAWQRFAFIL